MPDVGVVPSAEDSAGRVAVDWQQEERDVDPVVEEEHPLKGDETASSPLEMHQENERIGALQPQHLEWFPHFDLTQEQMVPGLLVPQVQQNYPHDQ